MKKNEWKKLGDEIYDNLWRYVETGDPKTALKYLKLLERYHIFSYEQDMSCLFDKEEGK